MIQGDACLDVGSKIKVNFKFEALRRTRKTRNAYEMDVDMRIQLEWVYAT